MLSTSLRGVVSNSYCRSRTSRVRGALEILVNTPASQNLIRQGKLDQLENVMQAGAHSDAHHGYRDSTASGFRQVTGKEAYKRDHKNAI